MNGILKQSSYSKWEEVNEASSLLISPEKVNYLHSYSYMSPQKLTPLFESDFNEISFFKEIQHECIPHDLHREATGIRIESLEESSNALCSLEETKHPSEKSTPKVREAKSVVREGLPRKASITTFDESVHSIRTETKTLFTVGLSTSCQPLLNSILKMSIGSFNSISTEVSCTTNAMAVKRLEEKTKTKKCCSCKKSKCLKLYCECFASGTICQGCNCHDCHNTKDNKQEILRAKQTLKEKNPLALKRHSPEKKEQVTCNCAKSGCIKKYCECFKSGGKCGTGCNCTECKNMTALRTITCSEYEGIIKKRKVEIM
jgi:hypothetical protein